MGVRRHGSANEPKSYVLKDEDINFVVLSYDVGSGKPHRAIFDAARALGLADSMLEHECLHVGDNIEEDYRGAIDAGWKSLLLDRECREESSEAVRLASLTQLGSAISTSYCS